jgi:hypothetical protein
MPSKPLDSLTEEQRKRLESLQSEIRTDKITVSFSIEDRDRSGRKKSAFISITSSRGHGAEIQQLNGNDAPAAFTMEEANIVHALLSKHVVAATYMDAVARGFLATNAARNELSGILQAYDKRLLKLLGEKPSED